MYRKLVKIKIQVLNNCTSEQDCVLSLEASVTTKTQGWVKHLIMLSVKVMSQAAVTVSKSRQLPVLNLCENRNSEKIKLFNLYTIW